MKILLVALLWACGSPEPSEAPGAARVRSVEVQITDFAETHTLTGTIEARRHAVLVPEAQGRVASVSVRIGDRVEEGDVLMTLEDAAYAAGVQQAKAARAMAEARAAQARSAFARFEQLEERDAVTDFELETRQSELALAEAQLQQAEASLSAARQQLAGTRVKAPFGGTVIGRTVDVGDMIGPNLRQPPLQLADLGAHRLITAVAEEVAGSIEVGTPLQIDVAALPGEPFTAHVERINSAVDPVARTVAVEAVLEGGDDRLRHGMAATVRIDAAAAPRPAVPRGALLDRDDGQARVMVLDGGVARARTVRYGRSQQDLVPVVEGLQPGERVLVAGHTRLEDGEAVEDLAQ